MRTRRFFFILFFLITSAAHSAPTIESWKTQTGTNVFFVENHTLPMIDIQVDFRAGTSRDAADKAGLAALTHGLLDLGVQDMDETAIANQLADLGAVLSGDISMDRASIGLRTLSETNKQDAAVKLLQTVLSTPQFPEAVFEREKARTVAMLKEAITRPGTVAGQAFWSALYPNHPYGNHATPESVNTLQRSDLVNFYQQHYTAHQATITMVGDMSRSQAERLAEQLTKRLPNAARTPAIEAPGLPQMLEKRIAHPASQAHVLIGTPAIKRGDADYFALLVGNYTLGGGGFVSRLMSEVREKRGLVYNIYSTFMPMMYPGPFQIGLQTSRAEEALAVTRSVLADFLAKGPSEEELIAAKKNLIGSFQLQLDSNAKILANTAMIGFYGLPLDYLDRYAENVEKVSVQDVKEAFARHVQTEHMVTVVVSRE